MYSTKPLTGFLLTGLIAALLCISLVTHAAEKPAGKRRSMPAQVVTTAEVERQPLSDSLTLVGNLTASQSLVVAANVGGRLDSIQVQAGDVVKPGQVLLELDGTLAEAKLHEMRGLQQEEARRLEQLQTLFKRGAISQGELDALQASVEIAAARVAQSQANRNELILTAPFAGTIGLVDITPGALVRAGDPLLTLDNLATLYLDLQVPEHYLPRLKPGLPVTAQSAAYPNTRFNGTLLALDSQVSVDTQTLRARVKFDNPDALLRPGMLLTAQLGFAGASQLTVPVLAVEYVGSERFVYKVNDQGRAMRTPVVLGKQQGDQVIIEQGLVAGDTIVTEGLVKLRDGMAVRNSAERSGPGRKADGQFTGRGQRGPAQPGDGARRSN